MENSTISGVVQTAQIYFKSILIGVVILLVGFSLGVLAKKILQRILKEVELNKIISTVGINFNAETFLSSVASFIIYLVTIVLFLNHLNITSVVLYIVVGAILMLIILTFLVGLKDVIPNFIAWFHIQRQGKIKEGSKVEVREITGRVEKIGYLETEIKTEYGDVLYVPNSLFLKSKFWIRNNN
ncbi:MAG TPA: mechanosensitive ion channel domain-containing protein [Candidatus Nanoarchaeia archaeon]|nr:mechanosensitive ion channel domain-containing protein [Candidatus Nanoarchaeia archaeon]